MVMATMGTYSATLCRIIVGFSGIFCYVLEFCKNRRGSDCRTDFIGASSSMGICTTGILWKKNFNVFIYCFDVVSISSLMLSEYLILNQMGWIDTLMALILPGACSTFPVFIMHRFFVKISQDIIEAAELDGASEWQIFLYIGIPLGMPGIMAVIVLTFLEYWNLVEQPAVFLQSDYLKPLSLYILTITKENAGIIFVAATIALLPPLLIFLCGRKYLESGISTLTEKG